jgi:hypothetical protein
LHAVVKIISLLYSLGADVMAEQYSIISQRQLRLLDNQQAKKKILLQVMNINKLLQFQERD